MLEDEDEVHAWVERAFAFARTLPPKTKLKPKKKPAVRARKK